MLIDLGPTASPGNVTTKSNIEEYLIDTAKVHARASRLFLLARFEPGKPRLSATWDDVAEGLRLMQFREESGPRAFDTIEKRKAAKRPLSQSDETRGLKAIWKARGRDIEIVN